MDVLKLFDRLPWLPIVCGWPPWAQNTPAGLDIQAVLVDLHLQAVIRACGLHVLERDLEQIQVLHSWLPLTYHTM